MLISHYMEHTWGLNPERFDSHEKSVVAHLVGRVFASRYVNLVGSLQVFGSLNKKDFERGRAEEEGPCMQLLADTACSAHPISRAFSFFFEAPTAEQ